MNQHTTFSSPYSAPPADYEAVPAAKTFGFWIYLMSDALLFAFLFATYGTMNRNYAEGPTGKDLFDLGSVFYETLLLLLSTLTCGLAVLAQSAQQKKWMLFWLVCTFSLGLGFLSMEYHEFHHLIEQGAGPDRSGFLSAFFTLVGTHGLHVSVGLLWLLVMLAQIVAKGLTNPVQSRVHRFSLFWHFLDLIWVAIFSVVYLPGVL